MSKDWIIVCTEYPTDLVQDQDRAFAHLADFVQGQGYFAGLKGGIGLLHTLLTLSKERIILRVSRAG